MKNAEMFSEEEMEFTKIKEKSTAANFAMEFGQG